MLSRALLKTRLFSAVNFGLPAWLDGARALWKNTKFMARAFFVRRRARASVA